jgi:hypothetical protein
MSASLVEASNPFLQVPKSEKKLWSPSLLGSTLFHGSQAHARLIKVKSNRVTYDTNKVKLPELLPPCLFIVMPGSRRWEVKYRSS